MKAITFNTMYGFKHKLFDLLLLNKLFLRLASWGLKPNYITMVSIVCGVFSATQLYFNHTLFVWFFLIHTLLDNFDGYLARISHQESKLGEALDHVGDICIGILVLLFSYPFTSKFLIVSFIVWHISEYLLLRRFNLLQYKFPTRYYAYIFMFKLYDLALITSFAIEVFVSSYVYLTREKEILTTIREAA